MPRLKPTPKEIEQHLARLAGTPLNLRQIVMGFSDEDLHWSPTPKDWSVVEILAHIRACADVWTFSIYAMLTENQPHLPLLDERRWAKTLGYTALSFETSFNTFAAHVRLWCALYTDYPLSSGNAPTRSKAVITVSSAKRVAWLCMRRNT